MPDPEAHPLGGRIGRARVFPPHAAATNGLGSPSPARIRRCPRAVLTLLPSPFRLTVLRSPSPVSCADPHRCPDARFRRAALAHRSADGDDSQPARRSSRRADDMRCSWPPDESGGCVCCARARWPINTSARRTTAHKQVALPSVRSVRPPRPQRQRAADDGCPVPRACSRRSHLPTPIPRPTCTILPSSTVEESHLHPVTDLGQWRTHAFST